MRCRGVRVRFLDGQFTSQKPHSMHLSTIGLARGRGFRFSMWARGFALMMTPGLRRFLGSKISLMRCMTA